MWGDAMLAGRGDLIPEWHRKLLENWPALAEYANSELGGVDAVLETLDAGDLFLALLANPGDLDSGEESETESSPAKATEVQQVS